MSDETPASAADPAATTVASPGTAPTPAGSPPPAPPADDDEIVLQEVASAPRRRGRRAAVLAVLLCGAAIWAVISFWPSPQGDQKDGPTPAPARTTAAAPATPGPLAVRGAPTPAAPAWVPTPLPAAPTLFVRTDEKGADYWVLGMTPQGTPKVDWATRTIRVEGRGHDAQGKEVMAAMTATIPTTPGTVARGGVAK